MLSPRRARRTASLALGLGALVALATPAFADGAAALKGLGPEALGRTQPLPAAAAALRPGDVVYIALPGAAGDAIEGASGSIASHVGLVTAHPGGALQVVHSYGRVREEPLARFLARGTGTWAANRFPFASPAARDRFVAAARGFLGVAYDRQYLLTNDSLYCSELVYRAFLDGLGAVPVAATPMDFHPEDPELWAFWTRFFRGQVPQGEPGISPGDYLEDPGFQLLYDSLREPPAR